MIRCAVGVIVKHSEIAELVGALTLAIEMTQGIIESEAPRDKSELAALREYGAQIKCWKRVRSELMKRHA